VISNELTFKVALGAGKPCWYPTRETPKLDPLMILGVQEVPQRLVEPPNVYNVAFADTQQEVL
jgi:hypothetical protein